MPDTPEPFDDRRREADAAATSASAQDGEVVQVLEEVLAVAKRRKSTGKVRLTTSTETTEAFAEVELDRYRVEVTRVPVGRVVEDAPPARSEGDTTIIPIVEERLVVVKQIFLVEEVRIRHVLERDAVSEPVTLRRQRALVEHFYADGRPADRDVI